MVIHHYVCIVCTQIVLKDFSLYANGDKCKQEYPIIIGIQQSYRKTQILELESRSRYFTPLVIHSFSILLRTSRHIQSLTHLLRIPHTYNPSTTCTHSAHPLSPNHTVHYSTCITQTPSTNINASPLEQHSSDNTKVQYVAHV